MSIEDHLLYYRQAKKYKNRVAVVKPEALHVVQSTLRIAGFRFIDNKWYLPEGHDARGWPVMYQKKNGSRWVFNIWYYNNWRRWCKEGTLNGIERPKMQNPR